LAACDLLLCLGGQTALEAASLGVPAIVIAAVDNQRANATHLDAIGAAVAGENSLDALTEGVARLACDFEHRRALSHRARRSVDGFGALRVAAALEELIIGANPDPRCF
jgi:spore coat polysaccharide biosynthesis predicted glycosyltransferase SpsG